MEGIIDRSITIINGHIVNNYSSNHIDMSHNHIYDHSSNRIDISHNHIAHGYNGNTILYDYSGNFICNKSDLSLCIFDMSYIINNSHTIKGNG